MQRIPDIVDITGVPPHIASWCVAKVPGFVPAILKRWLRAHPELPGQFQLVMCPVAEVNAYGGLPARIHELTDPRLTCQHFTGCSRPYYATIFTGGDAQTRCAEIQTLLPWSEAYAVTVDDERVRLELVDATEDIDGLERREPARRFTELLESGELLKVM
ncbi:MAG TPA: hypothetical protein VIR60_08125 [Gammaproteobacteria bacterium]